MESIYHLKLDLATLSDKDINTLARYYEIAETNNNDKLWLIAVNIWRNYHFQANMPSYVPLWPNADANDKLLQTSPLDIIAYQKYANVSLYTLVDTLHDNNLVHFAIVPKKIKVSCCDFKRDRLIQLADGKPIIAINGGFQLLGYDHPFNLYTDYPPQAKYQSVTLGGAKGEQASEFSYDFFNIASMISGSSEKIEYIDAEDDLEDFSLPPNYDTTKISITHDKELDGVYVTIPISSTEYYELISVGHRGAEKANDILQKTGTVSKNDVKKVLLIKHHYKKPLKRGWNDLVEKLFLYPEAPDLYGVLYTLRGRSYISTVREFKNKHIDIDKLDNLVVSGPIFIKDHEPMLDPQDFTDYNLYGDPYKQVDVGEIPPMSFRHGNQKNSRTCVGQLDGGHIVFITIVGRTASCGKGLTFAEMMQLFTKIPKLKTVLNLDGGSSSFMYLRDSRQEALYTSNRCIVNTAGDSQFKNLMGRSTSSVIYTELDISSYEDDTAFPGNPDWANELEK